MRITATLLALAVALAAIAAACGGDASPAPPSTTASPAPTTSGPPEPTPPEPTDVPGGSTATPPVAPGTFETAWGEAWESLPPGFPLPPDARPLDPGDPADGPVSGTFGVGLPPDDVVAAMRTALIAAGYSTEALTGPYEDGSMVIDSVGRDPACRIQTRVRGLSGTTMITILFGAACPWE